MLPVGGPFEGLPGRGASMERNALCLVRLLLEENPKILSRVRGVPKLHGARIVTLPRRLGVNMEGDTAAAEAILTPEVADATAPCRCMLLLSPTPPTRYKWPPSLASLAGLTLADCSTAGCFRSVFLLGEMRLNRAFDGSGEGDLGHLILDQLFTFRLDILDDWRYVSRAAEGARFAGGTGSRLLVGNMSSLCRMKHDREVARGVAGCC